MRLSPAVNEDEWKAAQAQLLGREKELTRKRDALAAYLHEVVLARSVGLPSGEARAAVARSVQAFLEKNKDWASVREFQLQMQR